jgi:hypothetical protein
MSLTPSSTAAAIYEFPQPKPSNAGRYMRLWYEVLLSERWKSLHAIDRAIYQDMVALLNGRNNGDLEYSARFCAKRLHIDKNRANRGLMVLETAELIRCRMRGSPQSAEGSRWEIPGYNGCEQNETLPVPPAGQPCPVGRTGLSLQEDNRLDSELDSELEDSSCPSNGTGKGRGNPSKEEAESKQASSAAPFSPSPPWREEIHSVIARAAAAMPRMGRAYNGTGKIIRGVPPASTRRRGALAEDYEEWIAANGRAPRCREDDGSILVPDNEWLEVRRWVAAGRPQLYEPLEMAPALGPPGDSIADLVS